MKKVFFLFAFAWLLSQAIHAQSIGFSMNSTTVCFPEDRPYMFSEVVYKANAPSVVDGGNATENLKMRIYRPSDLPAGEKRPLVVLIHGGGFISGSMSYFYETAKLLARKGMVAATIQYRLCKRSDCQDPLAPYVTSWNNSFKPAAYAAACDANDAIRYLKNNAALYKIDPNLIFVAGHSAGSVTAMNTVFFDQDEAQQVIPNAGLPTAAAPYTREPLDQVSGIAGLLDFAGAVFKTSWIDADENTVPVFLAHGTTDDVVAYTQGGLVPCLPATPTIYGASPIAARLKQINSEFYLYSGVYCGHEVQNQGFLDSGIGQAFAFFVKTVLENQQNLRKHAKYTACSNLFCMDAVMSTAVTITDPYTIKQGANCTINFGSDGTEEQTSASEDRTESTEIPAASDFDKLLVFPNPANEQTSLRFLSDQSGKADIGVFDAMGKLVLKKSITTEVGENVVELLLSGLSTGSYWVRMATEKGVMIGRLEKI
jgi:acetyl esterase/lipase